MESTKTNAYTREEVRDMFIAHCRHLARYWSRQEGTAQEKCEGLLHSVFAAISGVAGGFPCSLDMVTSVHPDDKAFRLSEGEKYIPAGLVINESDMLHQLLHSLPAKAAPAVAASVQAQPHIEGAYINDYGRVSLTRPGREHLQSDFRGYVYACQLPSPPVKEGE